MKNIFATVLNNQRTKHDLNEAGYQNDYIYCVLILKRNI